MNYLDLAESERPPLATRIRRDKMQVSCPICAAWRPAYCITALNEATAAAKGAAWACDGCLSHWHRTDGEPYLSEAI